MNEAPIPSHDHLYLNREQIKLDPYFGIEHFKPYDQEEVQFVEHGKEGCEGWTRVEFYPRVGQVRILMAVLREGSQSKVDIRDWKRNCRTGYNDSYHGTPYETDLAIIQSGLKMLQENGINPNAPMGYPEIEQIVQETKNSDQVKYDELKPGQYYLVFGKRDLYVFKYDRSVREKFNGDTDIMRYFCVPDELFGRYGYLDFASNLTSHTPYSLDPQVFHLLLPGPEDSIYYDDDSVKTEIYQLTSDQVAVLAHFRPVEMSPYVGSEWSRESLCIYAALQGLQYERWGKDEYGNRSDRYKNVNRENYHQAIEIIIERFGVKAFASEVETILLSHLKKLHTDKHLAGSPFMPHSDISPLGEQYMLLADQVILQTHPLPHNMTDSGHVVNAKSLFGDVDFWNFCRTKHPELFHRFVDFLKSLPKNFEQHGTYASAILDPVKLIEQYYPEAYQEIVLDRPDFNSETPEAIKIIRG